jgi:hypothetical protein
MGVSNKERTSDEGHSPESDLIAQNVIESSCNFRRSHIYASHAKAPGGLRAQIEHFRAFPIDAEQNKEDQPNQLVLVRLLTYRAVVFDVLRVYLSYQMLFLHISHIKGFKLAST